MKQNITHRNGGRTIVEVLVAVIALALLLALALPALSKARDDTRIAECANNLRLLTAAAHAYADDFDDKFFYHWPFPPRDKDIKGAKPLGGWYDEMRIGRYIAGYNVGGPPGYGGVDGFMDDYFPMGLGGRSFICPADLDGAARSYGMNFWASGAGKLGESKPEYPEHGEWFDRHAQQLHRLLLFTEALSNIKTKKGWVTHHFFGARLYPGQRFGGKGGYGIATGSIWERFHIQEPRADLDYSRHSPQSHPGDNIGVINITYADGHVALREHSQLYDKDSGRSTLDTLWSPVDPELVNR